MRGSSKALDNSAMERSVRLGKPVVQREITASLLPILRARSRWVMFFSLRMASILAMMSADSCTSDIISLGTAATFSLNHSCLFRIGTICKKANRQYRITLSLLCSHTLFPDYHSKFSQISVNPSHIRTISGLLRRRQSS